MISFLNHTKCRANIEETFSAVMEKYNRKIHPATPILIHVELDFGQIISLDAQNQVSFFFK